MPVDAELVERVATEYGTPCYVYDAAAIRQCVRRARAEGYRFSSLILGIATSVPFQMRRSR